MTGLRIFLHTVNVRHRIYIRLKFRINGQIRKTLIHDDNDIFRNLAVIFIVCVAGDRFLLHISDQLIGIELRLFGK